MPRATALFAACAVLLSACAQIQTSPGGVTANAPRSGGSAGQMGPGFCQTVPQDRSARQQWYQLCFPSN